MGEPRPERHHFWVGLVMPNPAYVRSLTAFDFLDDHTWVVGRTWAATMDRPNGDRHGARRKIACLVPAKDLVDAFHALNNVWDLSPDDVELVFAWRMPDGWLPGEGLGPEYGEDPCPPGLAAA